MLLALCMVLSTCAGPPRHPVTDADYLRLLESDLRRLSVDFDWGRDNREERRFARRFKQLLREEILEAHRSRKAPLTITNRAFVRAFMRATSDFRKQGALDRLTRSGEMDLSSGFWSIGEGNRIHAVFRFEETDDYLVRILLIRRPSGSRAKVTVTQLETGAAVYDPPEFEIGSFKKFRVRVNDMFSYLHHLQTVQVFFRARGGITKTIYRCFPERNPKHTVFYRAYPLSAAKMKAEIKKLDRTVRVADRHLFRNYGKDVRRLYYEIGLLHPKWSSRRRVAFFFETLIQARERRFLTRLKRIVFPDGLTVRVAEEAYSSPLIRVEIQGRFHRLFFVSPRKMRVVYDSGWLNERELARSRKTRFNFGSWLPDLWHSRNERLFMTVFAINQARMRAANKSVSQQAVFRKTLADLKGIGAYFEKQTVRINSVSFVLKIDKKEIASFLARMERSRPVSGQTLLRPAPAPAPGGTIQWKLVRFTRQGMEFIQDHQMLYYVVQEEDCRSGKPLARIRKKLRSRFPGTYTYPLVFSGFRDKHIHPGMLLPVPRSPEDRKLSNGELWDTILPACRREGFEYPQLVYAIVWNECRAGRDNFFRFEPGRLDRVQEMRNRLSGEERRKFDAVYGRFSYLLAGSWGPGHILYENAWRLGFRGSPGELADPEVNIPLIVRFLKSNGITRSTSVARISRIYNGPRYAENRYHKRLKKNLERAERTFPRKGA